MADWTDIDVNTLLPGQPFTSAIALAYEENPRALAAGAVGSPKVARKVLVGDSTGSQSTSVTFTDLEAWGGLIVLQSGVGDGDALSVRLSDDGTNFEASTAVAAGGLFSLDFATGNYASAGTGSVSTGTVATPTGAVSAVRFTSSQTGQNVSLAIGIELTGGDTAE